MSERKYENLSVAELRNILIAEHGFTEDDALAIKGKSNLMETIKQSLLAQDCDKLFTSSTDEYVEDNYKEPQVSAINKESPEWSDYVMTLFHDDEIMEKDGNRYPTLKGLRRVAIKLFGEPAFSGVIDYSAPKDENSPGRAYANYELIFDTFLGRKVYRGAAEAYPGNINGGYHVYPLAIAENRAEARAYRKALLLNVVTAEEIGNESSHFTSVLSSTGEFNEEEKISDSQMTVIKNKCFELKIDESKFLDYIKNELGTTSDTLTKKAGLAAIKKISLFSNDPNQIPGELK